MKPRRSDATLLLANQILVYLAEHPEAQDTIEGIAEWWLLEQKIKRETAAVKEALAELVAQGFVAEQKGRDGRICYQVVRHKLKEIESSLWRVKQGKNDKDQ